MTSSALHDGLRDFGFAIRHLSAAGILLVTLFCCPARADDPPGFIPLPPGSQLSDAAQKADEAPRWDAGVAPKATPAASAPASIIPLAPTNGAAPANGTASMPPANPFAASQGSNQAPRTLPQIDDAKPLAPNPQTAAAISSDPRPLQSV